MLDCIAKNRDVPAFLLSVWSYSVTGFIHARISALLINIFRDMLLDQLSLYFF